MFGRQENTEMTMPERQTPKVLEHALQCLSRAEAMRDRATNEHEDLVGVTTTALCLTLGLDPDHSRTVSEAARLHDIGKFALPSDILHKPGKLSKEEWAFVRKHAEIGHSILSIDANPFLQLASTLALFHHENYDGSGYPHGMSGDAIPLEARIVAVADSYEALRADRAYKRGVSHDDAISRILDGDERSSPDEFDPAVLRALERAAPTIEREYRRSSAAFTPVKA